MTAPAPLKIVSLTAENFKRLIAVYIEPDGTLQQITGHNAQGKSSVLDAIEAALGGKASTPTKPVRNGADSARVVLDLGDMVVTRKFTADGKSTLEVASHQGAVYKSPQAMLDKLLGSLSFDPLAFSRQEPAKKAATLRRLVGLDTTAIDLQRQELYAQRTELGRQGKAAAAQLAAILEVQAPAEEVSVGQLLSTIGAARKANAERGKRRAAIASSAEKVRAASAAIEKLEAELERARQLQEALSAAHEQLEPVEPDTDLEQLELEAASAEDTNRLVREAKARAAKAYGVELLRKDFAAATADIEALDGRKAALLAGVDFPVPGLSVDGDQVTLSGVPLEQASSAEQLRVGLAVAAALNPKLRVVLVRDGSLLDEDGLKLVAEWAERSGMQVLMERVSNGEPIGIVIEDGQVKGAAALREAV